MDPKGACFEANQEMLAPGTEAEHSLAGQCLLVDFTVARYGTDLLALQMQGRYSFF